MRLFRGVTLRILRKGQRTTMGDMVQDDQVDSAAFHWVGTDAEFDKWCLHHLSNGGIVMLEEAIPLSEFTNVTAKVNW
jgi:hypothetical protein